MSNYTHTVARFDHVRAARTLFDDLNELQVKRVTLFVEPRSDKSDGGAVYIAIPDGTDPDKHLLAVKNFSLGRGSHNVSQEEIPWWTPSAAAEHVDNVRNS